MSALIPLLLAGAALAQEPAPVPVVDPLVAKIEAHYAKVQSLRMGFTQSVSSPLYGNQVQKGTVAFGRPGKMHWTFSDEGKQYYSDGSTMWVYLEGEKQAFRYGGWDPSGSPEALLNSLDNLDELFTVSGTESSDTGHVLRLVPRGDSAVSTVELALDSNLVVSKVTLTDAMETRTVLAFSDVVVDGELPADTFTFTPPAGVEVIEAGFPQ